MAGVMGSKAKSGPTLFSADDDAADSVDALALELTVVDRDTIDELRSYAAGAERELFALNALRIGVLALRQARGRVDADLIRQETARMLAGMQGELAAHAVQMNEKLTSALKEYFDPESGRFHDRVQQLVKPDGELEQLLRRQIGSEDSELAKTLVGHFGRQSPLMKVLDPNESEGLLKALAQTLDTQLAAQRTHVLREFSLDNKEGALARMVNELTTNHGQLTEALEKKIETVVSEFSLDKEDSALSRLVRNVDGAQKTIAREFSLDNETSALSRMSEMLKDTRQAIDSNLTLDSETSSLARLQRELFSILETHTAANKLFQEEVKVALGKMIAKRQEADRSTLHGLAFEEAVCACLEYHAQQTGDVATRTGANDRPDQELQERRLRRRAGARLRGGRRQGRGRSERIRRLHAGRSTSRNRRCSQEPRRANRSVRRFQTHGAVRSRRGDAAGQRRVRDLGSRRRRHEFAPESRADAGPGALHPRRNA